MSWKAFQPMCKQLETICGRCSASCFNYGFVLHMIREKTWRSKHFTHYLRHFYTKINVTTIPANLAIKLLSFHFCFFVENKFKNVFPVRILVSWYIINHEHFKRSLPSKVIEENTLTKPFCLYRLYLMLE